MTEMIIDGKSTGLASITTIKLGGLTAEMKQVNNVKKLTVSGRGNVRQIKTIAKEFYRVISE